MRALAGGENAARCGTGAMKRPRLRLQGIEARLRRIVMEVRRLMDVRAAVEVDSPRNEGRDRLPKWEAGGMA